MCTVTDPDAFLAALAAALCATFDEHGDIAPWRNPDAYPEALKRLAGQAGYDGARELVGDLLSPAATVLGLAPGGAADPVLLAWEVGPGNVPVLAPTKACRRWAHRRG